jgi:hypothetical protein
MPLLNYTTTISAEKTVGEIHRLLVKAGARSLSSEYDDGAPTGVAFIIDTTYGQRRFVLPVETAPVEKVLRADKSVPRRYKTTEQAQRVAWRIVKDWLEAQVAIIETEMVTFDQVMLPYMHDSLSGRTFFEAYRDQQLALPAGSDE